MFKLPINQFIKILDLSRHLRVLNNGGDYKEYAYNILSRFQWSKADDNDFLNVNAKKSSDSSAKNPPRDGDSRLIKYNSAAGDENLSSYNPYNWKPEIAWLAKAVEPALQLYKWALPTGNGVKKSPPPTDRSLAEIFASIQKSKLGIKDWSLSDLTVGLYLIYLRQASTSVREDVKGEVVSSESIIQDLIYHVELAKGCYRDNAAGLARNSMLRERNIAKFIKKSSILRPGYYIGIDMRRKLVILGIRGTHTVYDLVTDIVSSSHEETIEGYLAHFGTAEAARWFLTHEMDTIRRFLHQNQGFRLRLVGHSLGGATASLLAIMLREKSSKELGFDPDIITAVGIATPPCVSKQLAESCKDFVTTMVMQDDIVPRLSAASLTRLRNEIVETDWDSVFNREDWKGVIDLVTNAKQVVSSVQDVARKLADYAKFTGQPKYSEMPRKEVPSSRNSNPSSKSSDLVKNENKAEDLYVPGTLYYMRRDVDEEYCHAPREYFTMVKRQPGEHFQRIVLSSNIISDHKCDSHYYALRDVLKGLPDSMDDGIF